MKTALLITPLMSLAMLCTSPESIGAYTPEEEKDTLFDCLPSVYANLLKAQKPTERLDERFPITLDNSGGIYDFIQKIQGYPYFQANPDSTLSLTTEIARRPQLQRMLARLLKEEGSLLISPKAILNNKNAACYVFQHPTHHFCLVPPSRKTPQAWLLNAPGPSKETTVLRPGTAIGFPIHSVASINDNQLLLMSDGKESKLMQVDTHKLSNPPAPPDDNGIKLLGNLNQGLQPRVLEDGSIEVINYSSQPVSCQKAQQHQGRPTGKPPYPCFLIDKSFVVITLEQNTPAYAHPLSEYDGRITSMAEIDNNQWVLIINNHSSILVNTDNWAVSLIPIENKTGIQPHSVFDTQGPHILLTESAGTVRIVDTGIPGWKVSPPLEDINYKNMTSTVETKNGLLAIAKSTGELSIFDLYARLPSL